MSSILASRHGGRTEDCGGHGTSLVDVHSTLDEKDLRLSDQFAQQDVYPLDPRPEVAPYIPQGVTSALDVGCGRGGFGRSLRSALGTQAFIHGIEPVTSQAEASRRSPWYDAVDTGYFPGDLQTDRRFDLVVFNDVLEHLVDPWTCLRTTRAEVLAPDGRILAAIPSIQYAPAVWNLLRGRWDYTDTGILDRTHVRFFTRKTIIELFESTGYTVETCEGTNNFFDRWTGSSPTVRRGLKKVSPLIGNFRFLHFVVVASPSDA